MKVRILKLPLVAVIAAALSLCVGCNEQSAEAEENVPPTEVPLADAEITNAVDSGITAPAVPTNAVESKIVQPAELPKDLKISPPLQEVVKLVQAGVSDEVILTYITNSSESFKLGTDEIIYLNDLGISAPVLAALVQHESLPSIVEKKRTAPAEPLPAAPALTAPATNVLPTTGEVPTVTAPLTPPTDQAAQTVSVPYFYSSLAPYGNWVEVDGYGLCWQPTVAIANSSWRPYGDRGRWLWTDAGWYWYSDYSWGWAPFHYGRWASFPRVGWVWCPDTVWGPSWVSWRYTSSYCGWAPLPPRCYAVSGFGLWFGGRAVSVGFDFGLAPHCWSFLPINRFCDRAPHRFFASPTQVRGLHRESTVINNFVVNNNTVVNNGMSRDRIARMTRSEIPTTRLVDTPAPVGKLTRAENIRGSGSSLTVSRPRIPVEGSVAATPPRETRRENGATVFPRGRELSGTPSPSRPANGSISGEGRGRNATAGSDSLTTPRGRAWSGNRASSANGLQPAVTDKPSAPAVANSGSASPIPQPGRPQGLTPKAPAENSPANLSDTARKPRDPIAVGSTTPLPQVKDKEMPARGDSRDRANELRKGSPPGSIIVTRENHDNGATPGTGRGRIDSSASVNRPIATPPQGQPRSSSGFGSTDREMNQSRLTTPTAPAPITRTEPPRATPATPATPRITAPPAATPPPVVRSQPGPSVRSESPRPPQTYTPPPVRSEAPRTYTPPAVRSEPPRSYTPPVRSEAPRAYTPPAVRSEPPSTPAVRSEAPRSYSAPPAVSAPGQSGRSQGNGAGGGGGGGGGNGGGGGRGKRD